MAASWLVIRPWSSRHAACSVSSSAASTATAMSASWKPTPWNCPTGWPNCWRVAAQSRADSSTRRARPTLVAATVSRLAPSQVSMRSSPRPSSPSRAADRHAAAVEHQLALVVPAVRDAAGPAAHLEAGRADVDEEGADRAGADRARVSSVPGGGEQDHVVGHVRVADEVLGAVDDPVAVGPPTRSARVVMLRTSEPEPGSVIARQSCRSPAHGRQEVLLDLVALARLQDVARPGRPASAGRSRRDPSSRSARASPTASSPPPPISAGMFAAYRPAAERLAADRARPARAGRRRAARPRPRAGTARSRRTRGPSRRSAAAPASARSPRLSPPVRRRPIGRPDPVRDRARAACARARRLQPLVQRAGHRGGPPGRGVDVQQHLLAGGDERSAPSGRREHLVQRCAPAWRRRPATRSVSASRSPSATSSRFRMCVSTVYSDRPPAR